MQSRKWFQLKFPKKQLPAYFAAHLFFLIIYNKIKKSLLSYIVFKLWKWRN